MSEAVDDLHRVLSNGITLLTDRVRELEVSLGKATNLLDKSMATVDKQSVTIEKQFDTIERLMVKLKIDIH